MRKYMPLAKSPILFWFLWMFLIFTVMAEAQGSAMQEIVDSFKDYTHAPREIAYAHLNKSEYITGETLGFTVYVFNKGSKKFSVNTRNIYCTISDENDRVIKSKLLVAINGVCHGSFFVDNQLKGGSFTFKAYTNYMKNFEEMNHYIQNFRVLTSQDDIDPLNGSSQMDAQFLPEGGHMVSGILNTVGVIIKDSDGLNIGQIRGDVKDQNGNRVSSFTTDDFGVGRFILIYEEDKKYTAHIKYKGENHIIDIPIAALLGINISLNILKERIILQFNINSETLKIIKGEEYYLTVHNGQEIHTIPIKFEDGLKVTKVLNNNLLFPGINVFTLFDQEKRPILERLYFNQEGIRHIKAPSVMAVKENDSIRIRLKFSDIDPGSLHNFSVSVLPANTASYMHSHNILSYTLLQPYIKPFLENASYYLTDVTPLKERQLDYLLATLGWSSYDWKTLFNHNPSTKFEFEDGISILATLPERRFDSYLVNSSEINFTMVDIDKDQEFFKLEKNYPFEDTQIYISGLSKNGRTSRPQLYLQFSPSKIPDFNNYIKILPYRKPNIVKDATFQNVLETSWTGVEMLDEIVLNVNRKKERFEELNKKETGLVDVFDDSSVRFNDFAMYLRSKGYTVNDQQGQFLVTSAGRNSGRSISPVFVLDDVRLSDPSILAQLDMSIIDYTIIDKSSLQYMGNSGGGVIKIYTDPTRRRISNSVTTLELDYPLTFGYSKKFYAPRYSFYQSNFFKKYGVIEWIPKLTLDENSEFSFKVPDNGYRSMVLKLEGSADAGFLSKTIELEISDDD